MREILVSAMCAFILTPTVLLSVSVVAAQVMQSGNYRIQSDSVNFGGGYTTSTNYNLESTAGEVGTGDLSSASYGLGAGYQQMQETYLSMSGFSSVSLSPSIPGVSGGFANGSTSVLILTDSAAGYELQVSASESPAMRKGSDTIADYAPVGANPDYTFITDPPDSHLGYTPEGVDIVQRFKDGGGLCNTGSSDTSLACWDGLSTTGEPVARRTSANHPAGSTTTLNFRVGIGGAVLQPSGTYTATTTITAVTL
jgi:hypothetical protein